MSSVQEVLEEIAEDEARSLMVGAVAVDAEERERLRMLPLDQLTRAALDAVSREVVK